MQLDYACWVTVAGAGKLLLGSGEFYFKRACGIEVYVVLVVCHRDTGIAEQFDYPIADIALDDSSFQKLQAFHTDPEIHDKVEGTISYIVE